MSSNGGDASVRVSGIARRIGSGEGPILARLLLVMEDAGELGRVARGEPFEVERPDGTRVHVEIADNATLEPVVVERRRWEDVENDPEIAPLRERAPGPHVTVRVTRSRLADGDPVDILCQALEEVFDEPSGHRTAPNKRLTRVRATAIASGKDATKIIDRLVAPPRPEPRAPAPATPKKPKPARRRGLPTPRGALVFGGLAVALGLAALSIPFSPLTVDLAATAAGLLAPAVVSWAVRHGPRFVIGQKGRDDEVKSDLATGVLYLTIVPAGLGFITGIFEDWQTPWKTLPAPHAINASWLPSIVLALWGTALLVILVRGSRASDRRLLGSLLAAPPFPATAPLAGTWGSFEGTVRDPTPVTADGEAMAVVHVVDETMTEGSNPNIYTERVLSKGTFHVDGPGGSFEIDPSGACWTSAFRFELPKGTGTRQKRVEHVQAIPLEGSILVAGRATRAGKAKAGTIHASGPESLIFVAAPPGKSARIAARQMQLRRAVAIGVALGTVAFAVALMVEAEPRLPPSNIPGSGD